VLAKNDSDKLNGDRLSHQDLEVIVGFVFCSARLVCTKNVAGQKVHCAFVTTSIGNILFAEPANNAMRTFGSFKEQVDHQGEHSNLCDSCSLLVQYCTE
jgi:hypothetical protein